MQIIMTKRKSAVLSGSTLACLSSIPTINVTLGCAHDCVYCYGKTYKCYPGEGKLLVYSNLLEKARAELQRKHRRPPCVYFCPSCDPFQPLPGVLDVSYGLMEFFLGEGAGITFLTKARVPERFVRLFERHPGCVSGQVGLTALDEDLLRLTEPMAASPKERLAGMSELSGIGVPVAIRLDPIWPALTDTEACLDELLKAAKQNGAKAVAASYLFLRPKLKRPVFGALADPG